MARQREVKRYAGMLVIKLNPADEEDLGLTVGTVVDVDDIVIVKKRRKKK